MGAFSWILTGFAAYIVYLRVDTTRYVPTIFFFFNRFCSYRKGIQGGDVPPKVKVRAFYSGFFQNLPVSSRAIAEPALGFIAG